MSGKRIKKPAGGVGAAVARQLLPKDWPDDARRCVVWAAREYHRHLGEPYAVPDVAMDEALARVDSDLYGLDRDGALRDSSRRWYGRYERGKLGSEIKRAITTWSRTVGNAEPKM